jgi:hemoglobin
MKRPGPLSIAGGQLVVAVCIASAAAISGATEPKLFDRLGGLPAIKAVVDRTLHSAARDPRTSRSFKDIKVDGLKESVVEQLCEATGGPCKYEGATMAKVHQGLEISPAEFDAFSQQLVETLDYFKVGAREKDELLQLLAPMRPEIVGK